MVKTYLRYQLTDTFGCFSGKDTKIDTSGKKLLLSYNDRINVLNSKTGDVISAYTTEVPSKVSCFSQADGLLAVGYANGVVVIINTKEEVEHRIYSIHKSEVTCLFFFENYLFTGAKDTKVYCWDLLSDSLLYCLSGHKNAVSKIDLVYLPIDGEAVPALVTSSKDNTVKLWNFKTQEVLQTIADLINKVTYFEVFEDYLVVGGADKNLKVYQIEPVVENLIKRYLVPRGDLKRKTGDRVRKIIYERNCLFVLTENSSVEVFKVLRDEETIERLSLTSKKENLLKESNRKQAENAVEENTYDISEKFFRLFVLENDERISDLVFKGSRLYCSLETNAAEIYDVKFTFPDILFEGMSSVKDISIEKLVSVDKSALFEFGHREVLRFIKFGYKGYNYLTSSNESVKLWNIEADKPIRSIDKTGVNSAIYLASDQYVMLATKYGEIALFDANSAAQIVSFQAHEGDIWNLQMFSFNKLDQSYFIASFSSDKNYKVWRLTLEDMKLILEAEINVGEAITYGLVYDKFVAYSLFDNSIKINFLDSNKQRLSLYGHKVFL